MICRIRGKVQCKDKGRTVDGSCEICLETKVIGLFGDFALVSTKNNIFFLHFLSMYTNILFDT